MNIFTPKWSVLFLALLGVSIAYALFTAPDLSSIEGCPITAIHQIKLCADNPNYIALDEVSEKIIQTVISAEDISFYKHHGFDFYEMVQSVKKNLLHLQFVRGGSTITQQVVKNVFLSENKSLHRKLQEAYLTVRLERKLDKQQILEKYLNLIELGPNIYGIKAAAKFYFHKQAKDLTTLESAYLTHLLPNPKLYSQSFQQRKLSEFNRARVLHICRMLWATGSISANEYLSLEQSIDDFPWRRTTVT